MAKRKRVKAELLRVHENAAGIDIGNETHWVAVPSEASEEPVRQFGTYTEDLRKLVDWLVECGVKTVAMEATGVYWIPVYELLEERGIEVYLVNPKYAKHVPGRKSDVLDCQWLQQLHSYGLLRGSFRPTAEVRRLRAYLRHREMLVRYGARHIQHMQKALILMNVQLHNVVSDVTGVTATRILRAMLSGVHDPVELAKLRDYRCEATE